MQDTMAYEVLLRILVSITDMKDQVVEVKNPRKRTNEKGQGRSTHKRLKITF